MGLSNTTQRQYKHRKLNLIDDATGDCIVLTVWNDLVNDLNECDYFGDSIFRIAVRGAHIVEFNEKRSLDTVSTTILKVKAFCLLSNDLKTSVGIFTSDKRRT